jgi:hypothetical protein
MFRRNSDQAMAGSIASGIDSRPVIMNRNTRFTSGGRAVRFPSIVTWVATNNSSVMIPTINAKEFVQTDG